MVGIRNFTLRKQILKVVNNETYESKKKETLGMSKFLDFSTLIHFVDYFDAEWEVVGNMYNNKN